MNLRRYGSVASDAAWLDGAPAHWAVAPVYARCEVQLGKMLDAKRIVGDHLAPYLRNVDVQWGRINTENLPQMDFSHADRHRLVLRPGDLLVCEGGEIGRCAVWSGDLDECYYQKALHRVRPYREEDRSEFLYYALYAAAHQGVLGAGSDLSTIAHLPAEKLRRYRLPFPPTPEQRAIVRFLERETARIDALIEKKRRQIELLHEKRAALISDAVTKGLDPTAPMKDSGLHWIGSIPAQWSMTRLKFISSLQTGLTLGKKYAAEELITRPYLRVANVQDGYLDLETITEVEVPAREAERYELEAGDVLMTEGGDFDKLGRGYVWEGQIPSCLHQNHIFAVRPDQRVLDPHFLAGLLTSSHGKNYFTSTSQQTTNLASTNSTKLRSLPVPLPPLAEQRAILASVSRSAGRQDALIGKVNLSIDRLREYRTALISVAVTGKLDVRQEVA